MGFKRHLWALSIAAMTASVMSQDSSNQDLKRQSGQMPASQQVRLKEEIKPDSFASGSELLTKLKNGEIIEYNGLTFDTQKLKIAQKGKRLSNFDFIIQDDQVALSFQDPSSPNNKFLILMPPAKLESLINRAIAKDNGQTKEEEKRPQNPHNWQYQSDLPLFMAETPQGRREMTPAEIKTVYKEAVDLLFKMHDLHIIDMGKMLD